ncbi:hypothetical protein [Maridesulfovibrio hydrothermalis]|uniref:4Fe-4S ferredoxin iron-sulfur binding domain protein n=1 Tax=Maridesulfovibrio hydrothermalis AM13 = DSM 14728 TaxID=1121451 RepID=L0RE38_9BACT
MHKLKKNILDHAKKWGATLTAIADTTGMAGIETRPENLLQPYPRAISIAVQLSNGIMNDVVTGPTELYSQHYQRVNSLLDDIACRVTGFIQDNGGIAIPIPASQILCKERFVSYISHKAVAINAGLGWQGKSLLLISPEYGPRIRLVTVLTDLLLPVDGPVKKPLRQMYNLHRSMSGESH